MRLNVGNQNLVSQKYSKHALTASNGNQENPFKILISYTIHPFSFQRL